MPERPVSQKSDISTRYPISILTSGCGSFKKKGFSSSESRDLLPELNLL